MLLALLWFMAIGARLTRWAGARASRRLARSMPWIGAAVALATIATTVRRKGWIGGATDTALNATPFVGALKNAAETIRGRDFIPDRGSV
ncbi:MAG: hypothetical protein ACM36C_16610 [Acidobacteriota bacterium]